MHNWKPWITNPARQVAGKDFASLEAETVTVAVSDLPNLTNLMLPPSILYSQVI